MILIEITKYYGEITKTPFLVLGSCALLLDHCKSYKNTNMPQNNSSVRKIIN